jgi:hypothetical protein
MSVRLLTRECFPNRNIFIRRAQPRFIQQKIFIIANCTTKWYATSIPGQEGLRFGVCWRNITHNRRGHRRSNCSPERCVRGVLSVAVVLAASLHRMMTRSAAHCFPARAGARSRERSLVRALAGGSEAPVCEHARLASVHLHKSA